MGLILYIRNEKHFLESWSERMRRFTIFLLILLIQLTALSVFGRDKGVQTYRLDKVQLGQCLTQIAVPLKWNKKVYLLAHGFVPAAEPITAVFHVEDELYQKLLAEGWIIGSTSYRRNGMIIKDAQEDIHQLRSHIVKRYGQPDRVIVQGKSMGGLISVLIAETGAGDYHGVLSLGMAPPRLLQIDNCRFTYKPKIPILFMSNRDELDNPRAYLSAYLSKASDADAPATLWHVQRDGHVNLSSAEIRKALDALTLYLDKSIKPAANFNATVKPSSGPSKGIFKDGGVYTRITYIHPVYGNIDTQVTVGDLKRLGIAHKTTFQLQLGDKTVKVFYGTAYNDVPKGEWVAAVNAKGIFKIARNFKNAAAALGCKTGDLLFIKKID